MLSYFQGTFESKEKPLQLVDQPYYNPNKNFSDPWMTAYYVILLRGSTKLICRSTPSKVWFKYKLSEIMILMKNDCWFELILKSYIGWERFSSSFFDFRMVVRLILNLHLINHATLQWFIPKVLIDHNFCLRVNKITYIT